MNYNEMLEAARANLGALCKGCPECNGRACGNKIPGPGAKGVGDTEENLREFNEILDSVEIDVQVLGVGPDGHLGFNEPGAELVDGAHKEVLDESTIDANARFFASRDDVPRYAVTMGMGNIMRAKKLLLIISGNKQEAARRLLLEDKITTDCPATFMKLHRDAVVFIEKKLADEIGYKG